MRGPDTTQHAMFSYRCLEKRIPTNNSLRKLRVLVDGILASMHATFEQLYSRTRRPCIPPELLQRASLVQMLFSIRSERQLVQHIKYNHLYRWFVGLSMDDGVWAATTFTENRERLFTEAVMRDFFGKVQAHWQKLVSNEHFTVDGTLIDAWASHKSFVPKDGSDNQPAFVEKISTTFVTENRAEIPRFKHLEAAHGRMVSQLTWTAPATEAAIDREEWPQCKTIAMVASLHQVGGKSSDLEQRYYISSRELTALTKAICEHWAVENKLHWMLDVNFSEDACMVKKDSAPETFSLIRRVVINMLSLDTT